MTDAQIDSLLRDHFDRMDHPPKPEPIIWKALASWLCQLGRKKAPPAEEATPQP
ncbi:MAG: hypothetical protein JSS71_00960 [Armatimonadetes bacterium]|nr:hypothetical protein [Armatimonadota bacterium]MBX3109088.1 hypothetical protein [Fimbriimonadaceae bacterium]